MSDKRTYLDLPPDRLFQEEQVITQRANGVELHRTVVLVGPSWVAVSTPASPALGVRYFGRLPGTVGPLTELLPPAVGLLHRRPAPKTNRDLLRALGTIIVSQRLHGVTANVSGPTDGPVVGGYVQVPPHHHPGYVADLIKAYLPYERLEVELHPRWESINDSMSAGVPFTSRLISVKPARSRP